jgi:hypothetical protein
MFLGWDNFYILLGSASGGLIGLLFIVVTLTSNMDRDRALQGASRYMTPTVLLFAAVLLVSAIASAPLPAPWHRVALTGTALVLLVWALTNVWRMFGLSTGAPPTHWTDPWCYAGFPALAYLALGGAAAAGSGLGVGVMAATILMLGVRNAWDLITWIAPRGGAGGGVGGEEPIPPPE